MAKSTPFKVDGFQELNAKLKRLDDKATRREVLALQKKLARPLQLSYAANLPQGSGNLARSVAIRAVSIRRSGGNPTISIAPGKRGKNDGYYKFMVVPKGTRLGSNKRGSRKGFNTVTKAARDRTLGQNQGAATLEAEKKTAQLIQKKINRL